MNGITRRTAIGSLAAGARIQAAKQERSFLDRLLPAPKAGGFRQSDYWVWCGSPVRGEDRRYHLFASRWPQAYPFFSGYPAYSEIVRAVADTPVGPYRFAEVVLPARGEQYWDGRMTHNPTIHYWRGHYLLFYIGSTYRGPAPAAADLAKDGTSQTRESYSRICIGLATASSVKGPWRRLDDPILRARAGKWDSAIVTNPAPCVLPNGRIVMMYRSNTPQGLRLGVAGADRYDKPFERISDDPVDLFSSGAGVEDPYLWWAADHFEAIMKDMSGSITGERHAGIHATSPDGLKWSLKPQPKAYSRTIRWDDGSTTTQGSVERPQLLFDGGHPTHLFAATGDGPGGFEHANNTWTMVIPLA